MVGSIARERRSIGEASERNGNEPAVHVACVHLGVVNDAIGSKLRHERCTSGAARRRHPSAPSLGQLNRHLAHGA